MQNICDLSFMKKLWRYSSNEKPEKEGFICTVS